MKPKAGNAGPPRAALTPLRGNTAESERCPELSKEARGGGVSEEAPGLTE